MGRSLDVNIYNCNQSIPAWSTAYRKLSAFSWCLMLLPAFLPIVVALAFVVVMAIWAIVDAILN